MKNYIMVGCDLHDRSMLLRIAHNQGKAQTKSYGTDRGARQKMVADLQRRAREAGNAGIFFCYEASAQGYGLYDDSREAGIFCHVLAPSRLPHSSRGRKQKCDEKDAQMILEVVRAHVLAGNELPAVWVPDMKTRDDRELLRARLDAKDKAVSIQAQMTTLLKRQQIEKPSEMGKKWTQKHRTWLKALIDKGCALGEGARQALASLWNQLMAMESEIARLDLAIRALAATKRYVKSVQEVLRLKGVGVLTAMVFLSEMGDLSRFHNRRAIGAYLGLVPSSDESGEADDRKGHITRQGSARVRKVLCQAVWSRVRTDPKEKLFYQRVVARNPQHKKIAVVAAMRRLAICMWHRTTAVHSKDAVGFASLSPDSASPTAPFRPPRCLAVTV